MDISITFLGTATILLEIGSFRILTDPVFSKKGTTDSVLGLARYSKTYEPIASKDRLDNLDLVLLTHHHHGDNLDAEGLAVARKAKRLLTTGKAARALGANAEGLGPWSSIEVISQAGEKLKITATPCQHGPKFLNWLTGPVIGFVLESPSFKSGPVYISGDTVMFDGVREVAQKFKIGTAILHVGRAHFAVTPLIDYTFSATGAAEAAKLLGPKKIIPIHYEGWSHFKDGKSLIEKTFSEQKLDSITQWLIPGIRTSLEI